MNGPPAVVREPCQPVGPRGGGHRDHVGQVVARGVHGGRVVVAGVVGGRGHEEDPLLHVSLDGVEHGLGEPAAAPAVAGRDDVDAAALHEGHVVQAPESAHEIARATGRQELARHETDGPVDADDADVIVPDRPDRAGHVRAVAVVVHGVGIAVDGVDPEAVVGVAVAVVVGPVAAAVGLVPEHVRREIRVRVVDAGVDDDHHHVPASGRQVPRGEGADVRARNSAVLTGIVESPQSAQARIAGSRLCPEHPVRLRVEDGGVAAVQLEGLPDAHPGRDLHRLKAPDDPEGPVHARSGQRVGLRPLLGRRELLEPHQNGVLGVAEGGLGGGARVRGEHRAQGEDDGRPELASATLATAHRQLLSPIRGRGPQTSLRYEPSQTLETRGVPGALQVSAPGNRPRA